MQQNRNAPANPGLDGAPAVSGDGVAQGDYTCDAFERLRVRTLANQSVSANNGTTHYVWDIFGNIIAEADGATGATLRETVYLDGMPLSAIDAVASPRLIYAVHVDHLNRPIMLTDASKVNVWWASYEPFGRVRATGGAITQNLQLPGQWFQLETGLAYNWHRHYDPTTGRYTTPDPLGFVDGPSVFAYAGSGPQRVVDPTGLFTATLAAATATASFCPIELISRKRRSPTYYCQDVRCGAPHGGAADPHFSVCPDCATKNARGWPLKLENGLVVPPGTLKEPGQ